MNSHSIDLASPISPVNSQGNIKEDKIDWSKKTMVYHMLS